MSLLLGKKVVFTTSKMGAPLTGVVMDRVDMFQKLTDSHTVTGYIIQAEDGKLYNNIAFWRLVSLVEDNGKTVPFPQTTPQAAKVPDDLPF